MDLNQRKILEKLKKMEILKRSDDSLVMEVVITKKAKDVMSIISRNRW